MSEARRGGSPKIQLDGGEQAPLPDQPMLPAHLVLGLSPGHVINGKPPLAGQAAFVGLVGRFQI